MITIITIINVVVAGILLPIKAWAAESDESSVERKIEVLTEEVEKMKAGKEVFTDTLEGRYGLAPAASKVYRSKSGISLGGYGEMLYENFFHKNEAGAPSGKTDQIDFLRAVFYIGYKFSDKFLFNSELEFEHASTGNAGSVSVEFATLEYLWRDALNFRAGLLLVPMGFINELHEPPIFLGTERPETETQIIPSTWREAGAGIFGSASGFSYRGYLIAGFDGVGGGTASASGFSGSGLRGGRQQGSKSLAEDFAGVARVDYEDIPGLVVGTSAYLGKSGQTNGIGALTTIVEGHADYRLLGAQFRGLLSYAHVGEAGQLSSLAGSTIGSDLLGFYLEGGYDILHAYSTDQAVIPFVRYEWLDTQHKVAGGFAANPANSRSILTAGVTYRPILNIVLKSDYQRHQNNANTGVDQINFAVGYLF